MNSNEFAFNLQAERICNRMKKINTQKTYFVNTSCLTEEIYTLERHSVQINRWWWWWWWWLILITKRFAKKIQLQTSTYMYLYERFKRVKSTVQTSGGNMSETEYYRVQHDNIYIYICLNYYYYCYYLSLHNNRHDRHSE